ncbi:MAG: hypothetical protein LC647_00450 [Beggiatoa sp.]|nr:hypothetical protein [Beggiatoa sp.]
MNINKNDDVLSEKGITWGLVGDRVKEYKTVENIERIFKAAKKTDSRSSSSSCSQSSR